MAQASVVESVRTFFLRLSTALVFACSSAPVLAEVLVLSESLGKPDTWNAETLVSVAKNEKVFGTVFGKTSELTIQFRADAFVGVLLLPTPWTWRPMRENGIPTAGDLWQANIKCTEFSICR